MNTWYVYVDYRLDTSLPFYVGKGDAARVKRQERNRYHQNIVAKHGFRRDVVFETQDERVALDREVTLIRELRTRDRYGGANFTDGGDGVSGLKHSPEAIKKNRVAHTGVCYTEQTCEKKKRSMLASVKVRRQQVQRLGADGNVTATYGSVSEAARAIGKPGSATLVSRCCRGKVATFLGSGWRYVGEPSDVSVTRASSRTSRVEQVNVTTGLVERVHDSISAAARSLGKNNVSIRQCCHGKRQTAYGFTWRFVV